jgi:type IV pilus assembly protein PilA
MTSRLQAKLLAQRALFQRLQSSKKRNKLQAGFTLIELLITVVILGVVSAIAIPAFVNQADASRIAAAEASVLSIGRECAAARIAGTAGDVIVPDNITGLCPATGLTTFTSEVTGLTAQAIATLDADGNLSLTTNAAN